MSVIELSPANFNELVVENQLPTVVDFWADWCGPCKMIAPILGEMADSMAGKVTFTKVNSDEYGELAEQFSIRSLPTLLLFHQGKVVDRHIGAASKGALTKWLEQAIDE